jgi:hypothetical protein
MAGARRVTATVLIAIDLEVIPMVSRIADALRRLPVLARPRRRRVRKPAARQNVRRHAPQPRPARVPYILTLSSRRIPRRSLAEAHVPYLRMSGRWLEEHGFVIGSAVQVVVEHGRVTLISEAAEDSRPVAVAE